jgi:casein kinase II subunit beta
MHSRFIATPEGLSIMREKYLAGKFGNCPRVLC